MRAAHTGTTVLAVALVLVAAGGCAPPRDAGPAPGADAIAPANASSRAAGRSVVAAPPPAQPDVPTSLGDWPPGWRVLASGTVGRSGRPLVWFHLDAGDAAPRDAVEAALDAIETRHGPLRGRWIAEAHPDSGEGERRDVAGYCETSGWGAVVLASRRDGRADLRITAEPL